MAQEPLHHPLHPVSWRIRLWLTDDVPVLGRAIDASSHGMQVVLLTWLPPGVVKVGERYRLEISVETYGVFTRMADTRIVSARAIGFEIKEALPVDLIGQTSYGIPSMHGVFEAAGRVRAGWAHLSGKRDDEDDEAVNRLPGLAAVVLWSIRGMSDFARASIGEGLEASALAAVRHAVARDWTTLRSALDDVHRLARFAVRLEELSNEQFGTIESALGSAQESADAAV